MPAVESKNLKAAGGSEDTTLINSPREVRERSLAADPPPTFPALGNGKMDQWNVPKAQMTFAQQYVQAYKKRWLLQRGACVSAYRARQSVLSRMQDGGGARHAKGHEEDEQRDKPQS